MDLSIKFPTSNEVRKTVFKLKPSSSDGLLIRIHHSKINVKHRLIHACFHHISNIIASADNDGNLYLIDYCACKFWGLPKLGSCTFLSFSTFKTDELLSGSNNGDIYIIKFETGLISHKFVGHKFPVSYVSFDKKHLCLSASQYEGIIWNLQTNSKIQVLNLEQDYLLKYIAFIPVSCYILACFQDDLIQIWNNQEFKSIKQFSHQNWKNHSIKSITFTRNGRIMVVAGYVPTLYVFDLDAWRLLRLIDLPDNIRTVKFVDFVSRIFDGGCNKVLAILSGHGIIYFLDIEENCLLSQLSSQCEINKFILAPKGDYVACILCSGEIEMYNLAHYIQFPSKVIRQKTKKVGDRRKTCLEKIKGTKKQMDHILDIERLRLILKEFGEYPEVHRTKIWETLFRLPNNIEQYNGIINHKTVLNFENLNEKYPLESKAMLKSLKNLLNNLVTWCSFFANVDFLPVFVFPFVKVFCNKPVVCFEAVCTIILNWCQHWFEYFPLPPVNILAIIENVLLEHDPELLHYFALYHVTSHLYAWPLLESAFSEILTASEWLQFWDHVLTNEVSFLLCAVVAYNIIQRQVLLSFAKLVEFEFFFHNQNPIDMRKFIKLVYRLLVSISERFHPRQYLARFDGLQVGAYPVFKNFPKNTLDFHVEEMQKLDRQLEQVTAEKIALVEEEEAKRREAEEFALREEQKRRLKELEKKCFEKIKSKERFVKQQLDELHAKNLHVKRSMANNVVSQTKFVPENQKGYENKILQVNNSSSDDNKTQITSNDAIHDFIKIRQEYLWRLKKLLEYKYRIHALNEDVLPGSCEEHNLLENHRRQIDKEIKQVSQNVKSPNSLKKLNISTSIELLEKLIRRIETDLKEEDIFSDTEPAKYKLKKLKMETKGLEEEAAKLLKLLSMDIKGDVKKLTCNFSNDIINNENNMDKLSTKDGHKSSVCYCSDISSRKTVRFTPSSSYVLD